jgi:hypothetical protein
MNLLKHGCIKKCRWGYLLPPAISGVSLPVTMQVVILPPAISGVSLPVTPTSDIKIVPTDAASKKHIRP